MPTPAASKWLVELVAVVVEQLEADRVERLGADRVERGLLGSEHAGDGLTRESVDAEDLLAEEREDGDVTVELLGRGLVLAERAADHDLAAGADDSGDRRDHAGSERDRGDGALAVGVGRVVEGRRVPGGRIGGGTDAREGCREDAASGGAERSLDGADDAVDDAADDATDAAEAAEA